MFLKHYYNTLLPWQCVKLLSTKQEAKFSQNDGSDKLVEKDAQEISEELEEGQDSLSLSKFVQFIISILSLTI